MWKLQLQNSKNAGATLWCLARSSASCALDSCVHWIVCSLSHKSNCLQAVSLILVSWIKTVVSSYRIGLVVLRALWFVTIKPQHLGFICVLLTWMLFRSTTELCPAYMMGRRGQLPYPPISSTASWYLMCLHSQTPRWANTTECCTLRLQHLNNNMVISIPRHFLFCWAVGELVRGWTVWYGVAGFTASTGGVKAIMLACDKPSSWEPDI